MSDDRMSHLVVTVRKGERVFVSLDAVETMDYLKQRLAEGKPEREYLVMEITAADLTPRRATASFRAYRFLKVLRGKLYRRSA